MAWLSHLGLDGLLSVDRLLTVVGSGLTLILGLVIARWVSKGVSELVGRQAGEQQKMLARRLSFYIVGGLVILSALAQLGINLSFLLGAAGILSVAVGFASQTSASNLVSGLFLMAERPFIVGDLINIEAVTGHVVSIDLLAVRLRQLDNSLVRIPNETIIKSRLTNLTAFPIRRVDIEIGIAYKEDMSRVKGLLFALADSNPLVLDEPIPQFFYDGYGESALEIRFCVWSAKENVVDVRNSVRIEIKELFDREGVEIPFPHRSLYAGSESEAFAVRIVNDNQADDKR